MIEDEDVARWLGPAGAPRDCHNLFLMALLDNHEHKHVEFIFACSSPYVVRPSVAKGAVSWSHVWVVIVIVVVEEGGSAVQGGYPAGGGGQLKA